jgi:hypothetical protein
MPNTPRMRKALERVEARQVELEREIVSELERRYFSLPEPDIADMTSHSGSHRSVSMVGTTGTAPASSFTTVWYAG